VYGCRERRDIKVKIQTNSEERIKMCPRETSWKYVSGRINITSGERLGIWSGREDCSLYAL
jgi:hypothetical protein